MLFIYLTFRISIFYIIYIIGMRHIVINSFLISVYAVFNPRTFIYD